MRRPMTAFIAALAVLSLSPRRVGAKRFGMLYTDGEVFRIFGTSAHVDPGTGTDPIYTFTNSTNAAQLSVARDAPGAGSHGGRWAVYHATWGDSADAGTLVTDFETLQSYTSQGRLATVADEAADFRCPILPNG